MLFRSYPTVPRLGFRWQPIDNVSIIGENYFALCSEALMAGTRFEANAHFGPAHARVSFGADGIVYFDPFWFEISAYAEIAAGIKLWLLFGTVTIELSLGASVTITGPPIFVQGRFEICGFEVPFEFGDRADPTDNALSNTEFRNKYLRASSDAQVLQATVLKGSVAAGRKIDGAPAKVPDGSALNPFLVVPEFEVVFISTAPTIDMSLSHTGEPALTMHVGGTDIGVAPMMSHTLLSNFHVGLTKLAAPVAFSIQGIAVEPRALASFPKGIWGEAQDPHAKRLPEGKTVDASDGFTMSTSLIDPSGAAPIDYHQVELRIDHKRKPLPFVVDAARTNARTTDAAALTTVAAAITDGESNDDARFSTAAAVLRHGGYGPLGVAALRGERAAAPKLGSLADDLAKAPKPVSRTVTPTVVTRTKETLVVSARVSAVMTPELSTVLPSNTRTTVKDPGAAVLRTAPSIDGERAAMNALAPAALLVIEPRGVAFERRTILAAGDIALTRLATSPVAAVANASPDRSAARRLATLGAGLLGDGMILHDGEVAVIAPGSRPTGEQPHRLAIAGGPTRIVCFAAGGNVLFDDIVSSPAAGEPSVLTIEIPTKCERLTVAGIGTARTVGGELDGWYRGQTLPLVGWDMVLAASAIVRFGAHKVGHHAERANGGWANTRELTRAAQVATRFDHAVTSVAIAVDDLGGADAASAIEMRLVGAVRALDARGQPVAPTVLVDGVRSVLVYDITPVQDPGAFDPNVTVIVDNCRTGQLGGVVATTLGSASLVAAITTAGFDAAVAAAVPGGAGTRRVTWSTAEPGHGPLAAPPKLPAKKTTTAKKTTASTPPSPTRVARRRTTGPSARGDG